MTALPIRRARLPRGPGPGLPLRTPPETSRRRPSPRGQAGCGSPKPFLTLPGCIPGHLARSVQGRRPPGSGQGRGHTSLGPGGGRAARWGPRAESGAGRGPGGKQLTQFLRFTVLRETPRRPVPITPRQRSAPSPGWPSPSSWWCEAGLPSSCSSVSSPSGGHSISAAPPAACRHGAPSASAGRGGQQRPGAQAGSEGGGTRPRARGSRGSWGPLPPGLPPRGARLDGRGACPQTPRSGKPRGTRSGATRASECVR